MLGRKGLVLSESEMEGRGSLHGPEQRSPTRGGRPHKELGQGDLQQRRRGLADGAGEALSTPQHRGFLFGRGVGAPAIFSPPIAVCNDIGPPLVTASEAGVPGGPEAFCAMLQDNCRRGGPTSLTTAIETV